MCCKQQHYTINARQETVEHSRSLTGILKIEQYKKNNRKGQGKVLSGEMWRSGKIGKQEVYDTVYENVEKLTKQSSVECGVLVEEKSCWILQGPNDVRCRWKHVQGLYQSKSRPKDLNEHSLPASREDAVPGVLGDKVLAAISETQNNKAEGIDNIPGEIIIKAGRKSNVCIDKTVKILYTSLEQGCRTFFYSPF